ncbi:MULTISPECIES: YihY/virulence factor BrkB family protein [unclassified Streptomyces]|uniref:YihY/virulence factor BrkB family protein n=1 Tax=unclassified Streptomyces TaxID=2593676 RepID=UPI002E76520D|nr:MULTISPECIES: YihY/virulence factor BrkB family protein [unclassified Streptomyces]MEE1762700.1 YihY/virulence factor BrkB family protein [Streptomyces sp. SP18BB07]MEE1830774.1 YihY/virulence factor BrkB family protein [Streptomyces sp. SP17KL33]
MDWLRRLPVIGKLMRTHAWRAYERLDAVHWARLAAAITFTSFVALFPLITVGAAISAKLLSDDQLGKLQDKIADQAPGLSDLLDLDSLVAHAGSVGLIAGALLLVIGINWVGALRGCLRVVWEKEQDPGNPFVLKLKDFGVLVGLGAVGLVAIGSSVFAISAVGWAADKAGIEGGAGRALLFFAGLAIALIVDFLLLAYVLTRLPRVHPDRRAVLVAGLIGAVGFELLKWLLTGYLQGVAGKSMYGAFAVPVAVVLWINLMARLLLYCAAWTATAAGTAERSGETAEGEGPEPGTSPADDAAPQRASAGSRAPAAPHLPKHGP